MKNDVLTLINVETTQDADGFSSTVETVFKVFAEIQSVKRAEYYQAAAVGMNVQLVAIVNYADYAQAILNGKKPRMAKFDDVYYRIIKTYRQNKANDIELTLAEVE